MSQQGMPAANPMDMSGLQASPGYAAQGYSQPGQAPHGYGQPAQAQQGHAQGYGMGRDPAYPPPPVPNGGYSSAQPGGKSKILPIALGFTAVALLGAVATVLALKLRDAPPEDTGPVAVPATSSSATAAATAEPTPEPSAEPTAEPSAEPTSEPAAPKVVTVSLSCDPSCDKLKLDGKAIDATKPLELAPGSYVIEASKSGYVTQKQTLEVKEGDAPIEKKLELVAQPTVKTPSTARPPSTGTAKPPTGGCKKGPFLKKC